MSETEAQEIMENKYDCYELASRLAGMTDTDSIQDELCSFAAPLIQRERDSAREGWRDEQRHTENAQQEAIEARKERDKYKRIAESATSPCMGNQAYCADIDDCAVCQRAEAILSDIEAANE